MRRLQMFFFAVLIKARALLACKSTPWLKRPHITKTRVFRNEVLFNA